MRYTLAALFVCLASAADGPVSLAGEWRFRLDPDNAGLRSSWFKADFPGRARLPGSTDEQRLGNANARHEVRRFTRANEFVGPAWYQRDITIPESWKGKRVVLFLERAHWETQAWLGDRPLGLQNSLSTPHTYDLGDRVEPGTHRLTLRVDNRLGIDVGPWASAVTEEGPGNWNGIAGRIELQATDAIWIDSLSVYPDLGRKAARVKLKVRNNTGEPATADLRIDIPAANLSETRRVAIGKHPVNIVDVEQALPSARRWDEFSPAVYQLTATISGAGFTHRAVGPVGFREISAAGRELRLNGRRLFLRGTVDNGAFPLHGYPPADVETWRTRFRTYQQYGMNHVRFHSWCPPEAAFQAADELGIVLQVENPMWIGNGRISADTARTAFIRQEAERIVDTYGNHPSFCLMSMGNELGTGLDPFLGELVPALRARDPRRLYTSTTAPDHMLRPDDYFVSAGPRWQHLRGDPRLNLSAPGTAFDYSEYIAPLERPVIAHELAQWTVFPNLEEAKSYTGPLQPRYYDLYRDSLAKAGLLPQAEQFRRASGALMTRLYKEEIESILRTPGVSGYQLLGLSDWPGFGPAFIGVLDALNQSKGLIEPAAFRRFNAPVVPLLRMPKRTWTDAESLEAALQIFHYGEDARTFHPVWTVRDSASRVVASGKLPEVTVSPAGLAGAGSLRLLLRGFRAPGRYNVELSLGPETNDWDFWVYPAKLDPAPPPNLVIARAWDQTARDALMQGKTVVLLAGPQARIRTAPTSFTTSFWSLEWFPKRQETMGILCDPSHPALAEFSTAAHSDWQWWELTSRSRAFVLNGAPESLVPIVQVIDDVTRNNRLAGVIEARAGKGRLLAVSFDLESELDKRVAARQLRRSLLNYAAGKQFAPAAELELSELDRLFGP